MNALNSPELETTISRYFQAQMPGRWPQAPYPTEPSAVASRPTRGRFTLTAAIAVMLAIVVFFSYGTASKPSADPKTDYLKDSTANGDKFKDILDRGDLK